MNTGEPVHRRGVAHMAGFRAPSPCAARLAFRAVIFSKTYYKQWMDVMGSPGVDAHLRCIRDLELFERTLLTVGSMKPRIYGNILYGFPSCGLVTDSS